MAFMSGPCAALATREQNQQHHEKADPEVPIDRIDGGKSVLRDHVERYADEGSIELPDTADDEHDKDGAGALEAEHAQTDKLCRLSDERSGDSGQRRRQGVGHEFALIDRRADCLHAQHVLANTHQ
jgi:hypothetical protein